jgi:hypothetical protein
VAHGAGLQPSPLTPEQIKAIRTLRDTMTWGEIARVFTLSIDRLRRQADPSYKERQNANECARRRRKKNGEPTSRGQVSNSRDPPIPERPLISPPDTLVGILMGDPSPERSALAQKQQQATNGHVANALSAKPSDTDEEHRLAFSRYLGRPRLGQG